MVQFPALRWRAKRWAGACALSGALAALCAQDALAVSVIAKIATPETACEQGSPVVGRSGDLWVGCTSGRRAWLLRYSKSGRRSAPIRVPLQWTTAYGTAFFKLLPASDGGVWYAGTPRAFGKVTRSGRVSVLSNLGNVQPQGLDVGPDGSAWLHKGTIDPNTREFSKSSLLRIGPTGERREFTTPGSPGGLLFTPDGSVWFASWMPSDPRVLVTRITSSGGMNSWPAPKSIRDPFRPMIAGPDGKPYFEISERRRLVSVGPDGKLTVYPRVARDFDSVVVGPDERLWFWPTDHRDGPVRIYRADLAGHVSSLVPLQYSGPAGELVPGAQGKVWTTLVRRGQGAQVVGIDGTGRATALHVPSTYSVSVLGAASSSTLWLSVQTRPWVGSRRPPAFMYLVRP